MSYVRHETVVLPQDTAVSWVRHDRVVLAEDTAVSYVRHGLVLAYRLSLRHGRVFPKTRLRHEARTDVRLDHPQL